MALSLRETDLRPIAEQLGQDWEQVATYLHFTNAEIQTYRIDGNTRGIANAIFDMLTAWKNRQLQAIDQRKVLREALVKAGRNDLAEQLLSPRRIPDLSLDDFDLEKCQQELKRYYLNRLCKMPLFPGDDDNENCIDLKDIYTKVSIFINMPNPCDPIKIPLTSHNEIFTRKTDEGYFYTKMSLSAPAGLGKTTISAKIAYDWSTDADECFRDIDLLFVLNMRGIDHTSNLESVILHQLFSEDTTFQSEQLSSVISKLGEKVVIILDAVDEADRALFNFPDSSGSIVKLITGKILPSCRLLVTTRPWRSSQITRTCKEYTRLELQGFTKQDVITYIGKFFAKDEQADLRESLIKYLDQNEVIASVAFAPLMALLICLFWKETGGREIPRRITHLYDAIIHIMHEHNMSKQRRHSLSMSQTSTATTTSPDMETIVQHLGKLALKGLWPPENQVLLSSDEARADIVQEARFIGLISVHGSQESSKRFKFSMGTKRRKANPAKSGKFTFFHKSGQEKCAGDYLASLARDKPVELESYLMKLKTVQDALSVQLILRFASGSDPDTASHILQHLLRIFQSELQPKIDQYYMEGLDLEDTQEMQVFIELCLRCNYEAEAECRFLHFLKDIFPGGMINFLGLSAFTAVALEYFMLHAPANFIRSAILRPLAHIGDNVWPTGPLMKIHEAARQAVRHLSPDKMKNICTEYFQKHKGPVHAYNENIASRAPANVVAFIQVWQACENLPSDDSNISHFLKNLHRTHLQRFVITGFKVCKQFDVLLDHIKAGNLSHLVELKVGNTGLVCQHMELLAELLDKMPLLQAVDVSYNAGGHSLAIMTRTLQALESLQQLGVNHLKAPLEDMLIFSQKFPDFGTKLTKLYLNGNSMNDEVAAKLADHLPRASEMRALRITVGDLSKEFHNRLVQSFQHFPKLQELRTYNSHHINDLVLSVAGFIDSTPDIKALILHTDINADPRVEGEIWKHLREKLVTANNLKRLDLSRVALSREDFEDLILLCRKMEYTMLEYAVQCLPVGVDIPPDDFFVLW